MNENAQRGVLFLTAFLLVGGTYLALRFARGYRPLAGISDGPVMPEIQGIRFENVRFYGRDQNKLAWRVDAPRIDTDRAHVRIEFTEGIRAEFFRDGVTRARLSSSNGTYEEQLQRLSLAGAIRCAIRDLYLETTLVEWQIGAKEIQCREHIRARLKDARFEGDNLKLNLTNYDNTLLNPRGVFLVDESRPESAVPSLKDVLP